MPFRETLLNLAITAVLVLIVVLAGILLKESRPKPVAAIPVHLADVSKDGSALGAKQVAEKFEIFPHPELIPSRANESDTLRIRIKGEELIFVLYFVDGLEASMNHPQTVAEQGRYFGNATDKTVTDVGTEAAAYVSELLKTHRFNVLTRWERVPNTVRYFALIIVEAEPGKPVYLADLLMKKGYARLAGVTTDLPADARDITTYVAELQSLARKARETKAGIWAKVLN